MSQNKKVTNQVLELADKIGSFIEYWGFKQVHGRIWTLIFLSPEPVDANYLIENLQISKALASMSLKDLLHHNVIFEVEKESPSTQKYTYNPDILGVITDVLQNREAKMLVQIRGSHELLTRICHSSESPSICNKKLEKLGDMTIMADQFLSSLVALRSVDLNTIKKSLFIKNS